MGGASRGEYSISHTPVGANGEADRDSPGIVQNRTNRDEHVAPTGRAYRVYTLRRCCALYTKSGEICWPIRSWVITCGTPLVKFFWWWWVLVVYWKNRCHEAEYMASHGHDCRLCIQCSSIDGYARRSHEVGYPLQRREFRSPSI